MFIPVVHVVNYLTGIRVAHGLEAISNWKKTQKQYCTIVLKNVNKQPPKQD
jgi:hypothetical protein